MAGNGSKQGDSLTERLREKYAAEIQRAERHLTGAKIRDEMASADWEEDSAVIRARVEQLVAAKHDSKPPGALGLLTKRFLEFTTGWPWYGKLAALALVLGALLAGGVELARVFGWVK